MNTTSGQGTFKSYFSRNFRWLAPAFTTALVACGPTVANAIGSPALLGQAWMMPLAFSLGGLATGLGALSISTLSAQVVRLLVLVLVAAYAFSALFS
jgi:hypothetical protein